MSPRAVPSYRQAVVDCVLTLLTGMICAGLLTAAALVPAPLPLLPFIVAICLGVCMVAAWQSSVSIAVVLTRRRDTATREPSGSKDARALEDLRRQLEQLPEVNHPLGL